MSLVRVSIEIDDDVLERVDAMASHAAVSRETVIETSFGRGFEALEAEIVFVERSSAT